MNSAPTLHSPRLTRGLLVAGLLVGTAAAALGLRPAAPGDLPSQAVARVNDRLILRDAWLRAVAAVASERRTPLSEEDQRHILQRLIDEELLVQHGLALGLVEQDRRLRGQLVSDVLMATRAEAAAVPEETSLRQFYQENQDFFTPLARLRIAAWRLDGGGQRSEFIPPIPDALLPPAKLRQYLGPTLTDTALRLRSGEVTPPLATEHGSVVLEMLEREPGTVPRFEQIRDEIKREMQRRADEGAVQRLLDELRESGRVVVRDSLS